MTPTVRITNPNKSYQKLITSNSLEAVTQALKSNVFSSRQRGQLATRRNMLRIQQTPAHQQWQQQQQAARSARAARRAAKALGCAAGAGSSAASAASAAASTVSRNVVDLVERRVLAHLPPQLLTTFGPRADPYYKELWNQAGRPHGWPIPLPTFTGPQHLFRYVYVHACTNFYTVSLPAGEAAWIVCSPHAQQTPIAVHLTSGGMTTGIPTDAKSYAKKGAILDSGDDTWWGTGADWLGASPFNFFRNEASVKSGSFYKRPGADHPPLQQLMGGGMLVNVSCPYDGQAVTRVIQESTHPTLVGRDQEPTHFEASGVGSAGNSLHRELYGRTYGVNLHGGVDSLSGVGFMQAFGSAVVQTGASPTADLFFDVTSAPDEHFCFQGHMDDVDAVAGGSDSANANMIPRGSPAAVVKNGMVLVHNTGSVPVTVSVQGDFTFATDLRSDDSSRTISNLANAMRMTTPEIEHHNPRARTSSVPLVSARTRDEVSRIRKRITGRSDAGHAASRVSMPTYTANKHGKRSTSDVVGEAAAAVGVGAAAHQTGILGKVASAAEEVGEGVLSFAKTFATDFAAVGETALPLIAGAAL